MSRRTKIIIAVIILLLLLGIAALLFLPRGEQPAIITVPGFTPSRSALPTPAPPTGGGTTAEIPETPSRPAPQPPKQDTQGNLKRVAAAFAERYGSYSNQGNYENILDLKYYMTPQLQEWADQYVAEQRQNPRSAEYFGVTSRAISVTIVSFDEAEGEAVLTVNTQRQESGSTPSQTRLYYQDLTLGFVLLNGTWKVSTVNWGPTP